MNEFPSKMPFTGMATGTQKELGHELMWLLILLPLCSGFRKEEIAQLTHQPRFLVLKPQEVFSVNGNKVSKEMS